jgi:hypothetical protein
VRRKKNKLLYVCTMGVKRLDLILDVCRQKLIFTKILFMSPPRPVSPPETSKQH